MTTLTTPQIQKPYSKQEPTLSLSLSRNKKSLDD
jgi:hypothetical protein